MASLSRWSRERLKRRRAMTGEIASTSSAPRRLSLYAVVLTAAIFAFILGVFGLQNAGNESSEA